MATTFQNKSPNWSATGIEPPDGLKIAGFSAGYKPPAQYFNWFWTLVSKCIAELQEECAKTEGGALLTSGEGENSVVTPKKVDLEKRNFADGDYSISCGGTSNYSTGNRSFSTGFNCKSTADEAFSCGQVSVASGRSSFACNHANTSSGSSSFTCNDSNTSSGESSFSSGVGNKSAGSASFSTGEATNANGDFSLTAGYETTAEKLNFAIGKRNKAPTAADLNTNTGDLFIIGNGLLGGAKTNAFRVTAAGAVMGTQAYTSSGADYAEMFEWKDGNLEAEDRRGLFVTLDGEKIRVATKEDDYILGVVSANPTVIGDASSEDWQGKFKTDVFGARVLVEGAWQLSDEFNEEIDEEYASRTERPEWSPVGLIGKLVVVDDGTCKVNGYCYPDKKGIATASDVGYRVMSRIDENHVKIMMK